MNSVALHGYGWGERMDLSERCSYLSGGCIFETFVSSAMVLLLLLLLSRADRLFGIMKRGNQKACGNDIFGEPAAYLDRHGTQWWADIMKGIISFLISRAKKKKAKPSLAHMPAHSMQNTRTSSPLVFGSAPGRSAVGFCAPSKKLFFTAVPSRPLVTRSSIGISSSHP